MVSYPLIKEDQLSHKYAFLRASGATLLHLGASLKRVNGAIIFENGLVPPANKLLQKCAIFNEAINMHSRGLAEQHFYIWEPHRDPSSWGSTEP